MPSSPAPILPQLRFAAQISSKERPTEEDDGSWMNLIWFRRSTDDDKVDQTFRRGSSRAGGLEAQAEGYSIYGSVVHRSASDAASRR